LEGCGWSAKRIQEALELLRKASLDASGGGSVFSFSDKECRIVTGEDGFDVKLKDIKNCQLSFLFRPSTVHIQVIGYDCSFRVCQRLLHLFADVFRSQVFATAQQLRIHNSHDLRLHVGVRAAVVIESCKMIRMAPYRLSQSSVPYVFPFFTQD
uniref:TBCC domain-containing protein n=1 Tax=Heligmosomoides polygyrus TaxID=6339 RepID=A0A183G3P7_HELPZ